MKYIIILLLLASTVSCKKSHDQCYICKFGSTNGAVPPTKEVCGEGADKQLFFDAAGNPLNSYCVPK